MKIKHEYSPFHYRNADRDRRIYFQCVAGVTYSEIARRFALSKSRIPTIVQEERERIGRTLEDATRNLRETLRVMEATWTCKKS